MATAKTKAQLQAEAKKAVKKPVAPKAQPPVETAAASVGINLQHLTHIVTATTGADGFCYSPVSVSDPLVAAGLVEVHTATQNAAGEFATRANAAGIAYVAAAAGPFGAAPATPAAQALPETAWTPGIVVAGQPTLPGIVAAPAAAAPRTITKPPEGGFKVVMGIEPPPVARAFGARQSVYPFDTLPVGGSFFVIATEARPKPAKSLASTVNSAMARHAVEDGIDPATGKVKFTKTRQFSLRAVQTDTKWPDGSLGGAPWGFAGAAGAMVLRTK